MHLRVTADDTQVDIHIRRRSTRKLRTAADTAIRLLRAAPNTTSAEQPFGFALGSDTERAGEEP